MTCKINFKIQKSGIFVKKNLKKNMPQMKNMIKLENVVIIQGYIGVLHRVYVI